MNMKRVVSLILAMLMLAACAMAEEYVAGSALEGWSPEDFNGTWKIFYRVDGGAGSSTEGSAFQISMVIDGENLEQTFTYPDGEAVTPATIEYTEDGAIITYQDETMPPVDAILLEDGVLQWHQEATDISDETFLYFKLAEPEA